MQLPANGRRNQIRILGISDKGLSLVKSPQYLYFVIEQFEIEHFEVLLHAFDVRRLGDNDHVRLNLEAQYHSCLLYTDILYHTLRTLRFADSYHALLCQVAKNDLCRCFTVFLADVL